ncbi:MAG TPA: TetR/AcrR family transcriptional regulator [Caulobacteraceae bacterium]|jgi:AcrR family transcriptional regulator|nr:TetR/AcrR family transcriptional regulator [Caulobacteraceae bacterium]
MSTSAATTAPTALRLILGAMRLFGEKGYGSTSVSDILREAGANSGSLYHAFPTKQDLLVAVLEAYHDGIGPMLLGPAWEGIDDPLERIFALLSRYRAMLLDTDCLYGCPIGSLALEIHEPDPPVREALAANFIAWTGAIRACLEAARPRLPADVDTCALAQVVLSIMEGGVMQARTHRDIAPFDAGVDLLHDYLKRLQHAAAGEARR